MHRHKHDRVRRLATIVAADIVGYSRLMDTDEEGTYSALHAVRCELIEPGIESHNGRIVKHTGDGFLAEFPHVMSAVHFAMNFQEHMGRRMGTAADDRTIKFRIGINLGDIIIDESGDIFGDGVNIAARLEPISIPGGVCVSGAIYDAIHKKLDARFVELGPQKLRNISTPVRAYDIRWPGEAGKPSERVVTPQKQKSGGLTLALVAMILMVAGLILWLVVSFDRGKPDASQARNPEALPVVSSFRTEPLPDKSVAVLPCLNLSANDSHSYFGDALAAELITRLAAVENLRVPSHSSSFAFKGKQASIEDIASALKVRHVLECDVSGDASRVKVSTRLVDAETGYTLWTDSYNRERENLFEVQQEVALALVENLDKELRGKEELLVKRRWTENAEAYDHFLRGIQYQLRPPSPENVAAARKHLERAVELDPGFGRAYARLAVHWIVVGNYQMEDPEEAYVEAERLALMAIELDDELFEAYWALGWAKFIGKYDWQGAADDFRRTIELAPGAWQGYHSLGFVLGVLGHHTEALKAARIAVDLDPLAFWPRRGLDIVLSRQRDYEAAIQVVEAQAEVQGWIPIMRARFAALLALAGREQEAREEIARIAAGEREDPTIELLIAVTSAQLGDQEEALTIAEKWQQRWGQSAAFISAGYIAAVYAQLGDPDRAMFWLGKSRETYDIMMLFLDLQAFDSLRGNPRFADLIRELDLPEDMYLKNPAHASSQTNLSTEDP